MEDFLRYEFGALYFEGLIHEGAYFRNFTVCRILLMMQKLNPVILSYQLSQIIVSDLQTCLPLCKF